MKKYGMILLVVMLQQLMVSAQDLIVTTDGEEINCKITQIKGDYVYFNYYYQNELRRTLIHKTDVDFYEYNYFNDSAVQYNQTDNYKPDFPRWWISVNSGVGIRTNPLYDDFNDFEKQFYNNLKYGLNIGLNINYYFNKLLGVGLKSDLFRSSNAITDFKENDIIGFVGPSFNMRVFDRTYTHCFFWDYSIGYMGYHVKRQSSGEFDKMTGGTLGLAWEIGYDVAFSRKWSTGIQLSYFSGALKKVNHTYNGVTNTIELEKDNYEGLNRLNISIAIRFNL
jgi:hypothetical protein